jgi:hypothetical protein
MQNKNIASISWRWSLRVLPNCFVIRLFDDRFRRGAAPKERRGEAIGVSVKANHPLDIFEVVFIL